MASPFEVLRIDSDASEDEIHRAYRRRVKETHPDHGGSPEAFRSVRWAYEELTTDRGRDDASDWSRDDGPEGSTPERRWSEVRREDRNGSPGRGGDDGRTEGRVESESRVEYLDYEALEEHGWSLDDEDLFENASEEGLDAAAHGRIRVDPRQSILEAAEYCGFAWPFACRGGACANCAIAVTEGDVSLPVNHVLPPELLEQGVRLSCVGAPTTPTAKIVYNLKHMPALDELRLPPGPFQGASADD